MNKPVGNPGLFGSVSFGFALIVLGFVQLFGWQQAGTAVIFGVLYAALGQSISGLLFLIRKETYMGSLYLTFGLWLVGLYTQMTTGMEITAASRAVYVLALIPHRHH
jgi:succinate-acetate transporter protein